MKFVLLSCELFRLLTVVSGFWDDATSTIPGNHDADLIPRQSFFRWQETQPTWYSLFFPWWDWETMAKNRRTIVVVGLSIDFLCLGTGTILNRRTIITAANLIDPWLNRQKDLRVWALGNAGTHKTPYRYRVWRVTRLFPKSLNPEHWHGPRGYHSPRHDVCILHTLDQMFLLYYISYRGMYPTKSYLHGKHWTLNELWFAGSGYEYLQHIKENYKIFIASLPTRAVVDCSKFLPKWWGKFICIRNVENFPGIQNGAGLHNMFGTNDYLAGLGCFEIRYNEDRIYAFTDLRYYHDWILRFAYVYPGQYYEYAYPQWGIKIGYLWNTYSANDPNIPHYQVQQDLYPLGKK